MTPSPLSRHEQSALLARVASGELGYRDLKADMIARFEQGELRHGDCRVMRIEPQTGETLILKVWNRPGLRGLVRRLTATTPFQKERWALERLHEAGVCVPAVVGCGRVRVCAYPFTDALFLEDLGDCRTGLEHVKALLRADRIDLATKYLEDVVEMTHRLLQAGLVDLDHSFFNIVATPAGTAARLDLELAVRRRPGARSDDLVGEMLGRLVGTLAFGCSGHSALVQRFALHLAERTAPGTPALARARAKIEDMVEAERRNVGLDLHLDLPWGEE